MILPRLLFGMATRWLVLCTALGALSAPLLGQTEAGDLFRRIAEERDEVEPIVFGALARIGDFDSLRKLERGVELLRSSRQLRAACAAFALYRGKGEVEREAVAFLEKTSLFGRLVETRWAATRALVECGDPAYSALERVLAKHGDEDCRRIAADALLLYVVERGDVALLGLYLDHGSLRGLGPMLQPPPDAPPEERAAHRVLVRRALSVMRGEGVSALFVQRLLDEDTAREWRLVLIEVLEARREPGLAERLMEVVDDRDLEVALAALDAVGRIGFPLGSEAKVRVLLHADSPALRSSAVDALGLLAVLDPKWEKQVLGISREGDPALRVGAARALARLHTAPCMLRLHQLLADGNWSVRAEAVQQVGNLRRLESVPKLIERLGAERGRLREDVAACLRLLTGLDLGRLPVRWQRWWKAEGASFQLPPLERALAAETERRRTGEVAADGELRSGTSFYGVQIVSDRVCFILDTSGSMATPAEWGADLSRADGQGGPTRIEVAKHQLAQALASFPDGDYFNIVFFEGHVDPWKDELQKMKKSVRARALQFVNKQQPDGATALYDALQAAFDDPLVDTIFLLTDGEPTAGAVVDPQLIRADVSRWNRARRVRVHAIAIGLESRLLRGLAEDSGGQYRSLR